MKQTYRDEKWIGSKFGKLTVVGFDHVVRGKTTAWNWIMKCDCGEIRSVNPKKAINGCTKSCGCGKKERIISYNHVAKVKHGGRHDYLYSIWHGIKSRCYRKTDFSYPNYGGRGIEMCDEWVSDYSVFRDWAMSNGYEAGLSIDRIDTNGNYCPDNCRWATSKTQQNNRRNNVRYNIFGKSMTLSEISDETGVPYGTIHQRLRKGWDIDRAACTPVDKSRRNFLSNN